MAEQRFTRRAPSAAPTTFDPETRQATVVFTTGAEVRRRDWDGEWIEALEVTPRAVDMSRLNAGAPVLNAHSGATLADVIGVVERAWIDGGKGMASIRFSDRPEVAGIVADVASGILRNISVGYSVSQWKEEDANGVRRRTATRWTPMEISIVPIPADPAAQVRGLPGQAAPADTEVPMEDDTIAPAAPAEATTRAPSAQAERRRAAELASIARLADLGHEWVQQRIEDGTTIERARAEAIDAVANRQTRQTFSGVHVPGSEGDARADAVEEYFAARFVNRAPQGAAQQFAGMRMLDVLAEHASRTRGLRIRPGTPAADMFRMLTTSDVPLMAQSGANRAMLELYPTVRTPLLALAEPMNLPDFRPMTLIRLAQHEPLDEVLEGGEVTNKYPTENGETIRLAEYANSFPMTERVWINDDTGGIAAWLRATAQAAATRERLLLAGLLTAGGGVGPTLTDGLAWFHSSRGNIATSAALDVTSLGAAVALMRGLKDARGQTVYGLEPAAIVVSPAREMVARQLVASLATVVDRDQVNPWRNLEVIVEPALTGNRWWLAPMAASRRCLAVGYLEGLQAPRVETFTPPDVLGVTVRVTHRLAAAVQDPIGWITNAGG